MQNKTNNGIVIANPIEEVTEKIRNYFLRAGFNHETGDHSEVCNAIENGTFCIEVSGAFDDINVRVSYNDYKSQRAVTRELLAIDDRICNINVTRYLSEENLTSAYNDAALESIYVYIDGQLQRTTFDEYARYTVRNRNYGKPA